MPPYQQFFGGGPDSVRGFRESRLGPKDQFGNPYGGNLRITSQNEIILPMPAKWRQSARVSLFFDMGNVFSTGNVHKFYGPDGRHRGTTIWPAMSRPEALGRCRGPVAGAAGLFRFSFGVPLNAKHSEPRRDLGR